MFQVLKLSMVVFYLLVPVAFVLEWGYADIMGYVAAFLFVAHLGEYVLVKNKLTQPGNHFIHTLLFGFVHWLPLLRAGKASRA